MTAADNIEFIVKHELEHENGIGEVFKYDIIYKCSGGYGYVIYSMYTDLQKKNEKPITFGSIESLFEWMSFKDKKYVCKDHTVTTKIYIANKQQISEHDYSADHDLIRVCNYAKWSEDGYCSAIFDGFLDDTMMWIPPLKEKYSQAVLDLRLMWEKRTGRGKTKFSISESEIVSNDDILMLI